MRRIYVEQPILTGGGQDTPIGQIGEMKRVTIEVRQGPPGMFQEVIQGPNWGEVVDELLTYYNAQIFDVRGESDEMLEGFVKELRRQNKTTRDGQTVKKFDVNVNPRSTATWR